MSAAVNRISQVMELNSANFVRGAKQANNALDQLSRGGLTVGNVATQLRSKLLGMGTGFALTSAAAIGASIAIASMVNKAVQLGGELFDLSQRTGETVENLSRLKFAAEQEGSSLQQVAGGLRIASRRAVEAARGSKEAAEAFKRLGVDVRDANGNIKNGTQLLTDIGQGLKNLPAGAERTAAAMSVLGRSGSQLIPLLINLQELSKESDLLGGTISTNFARDADTFGDNIGRLKTLSTGFGVAIAETLLPGLNDLSEALVDMGVDALPKFIKFLDAAKFRTHQFATVMTGAAAAALHMAAGLRNDTEAEKVWFEVLKASVEELQKSKEQFEEEEEAKRKSREETNKNKKGTEEFTSALKALHDQFGPALNQEVGAIVELANSLRNMGEEGSQAFDQLISRLNDLAAAGDKQAQLALARMKAVRDAAIETALAEAQALESAINAATLRGERPEDVPGFIGPQRGPGEARVVGPSEEGFVGPQTREQFEAAGGIEEQIPLLEKARAVQEQIAEEAERTNTAYDEGLALIGQLTNLSFGFADAIIESASGAKLAFQDFFKGLLKGLAQAIVRATILTAILSIFTGGGFSLARLTKNIQAALGVGQFGFQDKESSMLGRAAQARGLGGVAGVSLGTAGGLQVPSVTVTPTVQVNEATPATWVRITDNNIMPRLRERQRRLNDDLA